MSEKVKKDKNKLGYFTAIKFLSKYMKNHRVNFIMFYFGWFFDMILGVVMPILFGVMIDEIVYKQNLASFLRISLVFVIMSIFSCLLYFLIYAQHQYLMSMYCFDIQRDIFKCLQKCSAEYLTDAKTGDIITTIQYYARECMHFVIRNIIHMANGIINLALLTVYIFIISPQIGLLMLIAVPVSVIVSAKFGKKIRSYSNQQREIYGGYVSYIYEIFTAIRDIRFLGAKNKVNHDIVSRHREIFKVNIKSGVSSMTVQNIIDGTNLLLRLAIFALTAWLVSGGNMTIGLLTVVMTYFAALTGQVSRTSNSYLDTQNRVGYIQRIYDFMHAPTEDNIWLGEKELIVTDGEIKIENITFAYEKSGDILRDFSLNIKAGERFALCGKSGCGKTTLGYMLIGFYRASSGKIIIDGQDISECSLKSIRKNIGMVSQDILLFDGSIKDNLLLGKPSASDEEIQSALKRAGIWDYILELPDGVNTVIGVGENSHGLSGGQKQRIAIARIYLKDPKIIIFDEATSSLDSETEQQIHKAWKSVLKGRTSVIIAHRQSAVMLCERAAIMENGIVAETGNPYELEKSSSIFRMLFAVKEIRKIRITGRLPAMLSKIKYRLEILRALKPFSFGVKRFMLFIFFISLISMILNFINPIFYKLFIDDVILAKNLSLMPAVAAGYLSVFAVNIILGYAKNYCSNRFVNRVTFKAKIKILRGFFKRDFVEYDTQSVGDMKMRMEDDTGIISSYSYTQTVGYIISYVTLIISAVLLLTIEWRLALFSFFSIPLTFWLDHIIAKRESVVNNLSRENDQKMSSWLHSSVQGWREIKALNLQKHEELQFTRYIHKFAVYFGIWINYWVARALIIPKIKEEFLMQFSLYFFGGLLIINKQFGIGSLLVFMQYYNILSDSLRTVSGTDAELLSAKPQSDRLLSELKKPVQTEKKNLLPLNLNSENIIEFRNVTFSYANSVKPVIDNLSFVIKQGERAAITGKSGAGKTTVLKLTAGVLSPLSGEVLFYGANINDINPDNLHKYLGFIMQENILFNTAIKENLLYAKTDASDTELENACRKAFIWDFIKTLPDGIETVIGERGIKLSGGQKQRLILARQFLRGTNNIFILDEATSALDQYSESIIQDAIGSIGKDKTIIVVAHRKSSISLCNRFIELK